MESGLSSSCSGVCRSLRARVARCLDDAVEAVATLASRVLAWTQWTPAFSTDESWTPYKGAAVLIFVLTALRLSKSWCFGNGLYLRRRVLLLREIRHFVLQWESRCLAEVEMCCADVDGQAVDVLRPLIGAAAAEKLVARWRTAPRTSTSASWNSTTSPFYGISPSVAFSGDLALEELLDLAYMAQHVLHLRDDCAWLQRFVCLLQYILLRRVSLMEEVRLYRQLYSRVMFPETSASSPPLREEAENAKQRRASFWFFTQARPLCAWRLHRRPTWLVPLAAMDGCASVAAASYLCLPLSYFPIESVLPYTAADSWLSTRLVDTLLPAWKKECKHTLRNAAALTLNSADQGERRDAAFSGRDDAACKISYWFLHFTAPLLCRQRELHREMARGFSSRRLYSVAALDEEGGNGSLRLLLRCGRDLWPWRRHLAGTCGGDAAIATSGSFSRLARGRLVRRALLFRAVTQAVSITLQVCFPRMSLGHLAEMVATGYCVNAAAAAATPAAGAAATTSSVDELLRSLAAQMAWTTAAGVAEVLLRRIIARAGGQLSEVVAAGITAELQDNLLHVDEAFFRRWLRGASIEDAGGASPSPPPQSLRTGSAGSFFVRRPVSTEDVLSVGRRSGEKVMAVHDAVVQSWLRCVVLGLRAALTQEWRTLLGAAATVWLDVPALTFSLSVRAGYALPQDVARLLSRRDEALPTHSPAGLRLLLEVLVEEVEAQETLQLPSDAAGVFFWRAKRKKAVRRYASLPHPYLALVTCASVWSFDHLLGESQHRADTLTSLVQGMRRLHTTVASFNFDTVVKRPSADAQARVAALQDDARCIAYFSLFQLEQVCSTRLTAAPSRAGGANTLHPLLDTEETQLLQTPSAAAYLPQHVDYFDLFSLPYRFILRQLGLEMVFAYRSAAGMQQESRQSAEEWWTLTLFNSSFNPLTCALQECVELLASCGTVLLVCARVRADGRVFLAPTTLTDVVRTSHSIESLQKVLRGGGGGAGLRQVEEGVCAAQQLCEWLPLTIWSEQSMLHGTAAGETKTRTCNSAMDHLSRRARAAPLSALRKRRRLWRRHLAHERPELLFDHDDRVVGGLRLRQGISWHHVYFCYPQLHGVPLGETPQDRARSSGESQNSRDPAVRPTLAGVTFHCPAVGMTAIIGPSGAGKSSLNLLLRRLYDPVPRLDSPRHTHAPRQQQEEEQLNRCACLHDVGTRADAEEVLAAVLRLALVEHTLPLPPPPAMSSSSPSPVQQNDFGLSLTPGFLTMDDVPIAVFSVAYLRQWLAWLPQTPTVQPQLSFLRNVRGTSPLVTEADVRLALDLCGCRDFVEERHRTLHDKVGQLSGGEGQRLALARVVASVYARHRVEVIQCGSDGSSEVVVEEAKGAVGGVVLDEPTSRLDAVNELCLLDALTVLQGCATTTTTTANSTLGSVSLSASSSRRTNADTASVAPLPLFTWMISHRMSSLRSATFMVVVEGGTVTATGLPHEVLQSSTFAHMQWCYQRLKGAAEVEEVDKTDMEEAEGEATC